MGLNICPPFLLGLSKTLVLGSVIKSIVFFSRLLYGVERLACPRLIHGQIAKSAPDQHPEQNSCRSRRALVSAPGNYNDVFLADRLAACFTRPYPDALREVEHEYFAVADFAGPRAFGDSV